MTNKVILNKNLSPLLSIFWKKQIKSVELSLKNNQAIGIVGIFGVGKGLFLEYLKENYFNNIVIDVNLKDITPTSNQEIYKLIFNELKKNDLISKKTPKILNTKNIPKTDFEFHYFFKNLINKINKEIIIIFTESQSLLSMPDSFWDNLESLLYYQKPYLQLIFAGQPGLVNFSTEASRRLLKSNYIYIKPFNKNITNKLVEINTENNDRDLKLNNFIWRYSQGHWGTMKYLLQKTNLNVEYPQGHKCPTDTNAPLNKKLFNSFIKDDLLLTMWVKQMFAQLNKEQRFIIYQYLNEKQIDHKLQNTVSFKELINLGFFKNGCFVFNEFSELILNIINQESQTDIKTSINNDKIIINGVDINLILSNDEELALKCLINNKNECVTYEQLGETIWKDKIDEKYSLWALNQLISRLRKKIEKLGLSKKTIRTFRGRGYGWIGV